MIRAWAMLAVSSAQQVESLAHQEQMALDDAAAQGWAIERVFGRGREGVGTGKHGPRAILRAVIAELRAAPPDARPAWLWMRRVDRASRGKRIAESQIALHEIADLGVRIWDHDAGEVRLESATDQIIAAVKTGLAALENEVKSGKMRAAVARYRSAGIPWGKVPYGLQRGPDRRFVAREPQASAVRRAFELRIAGHGLRRIGRELAAISAPYPYAAGERPVRWVNSRVAQLFRQRAYVGTIVDEVTFERASRIESPPTSRAKVHEWPLSGAIRCWCGRAMGGKASGRGNRYRWYVCAATWAHEGKTRFVRAGHLEEQFEDLLQDLAESPDLVAQYRDRGRSRPSPELLDRAIRERRKQLDALAKRRATVWGAFEAGKIRDEDVQGRLDELAAEREALEGEIAALERDRAGALAATQIVMDAAQAMRRAWEAWDEASEEEQRAIALAVAGIVGGLCAEEDGSLGLRYPEDPAAQLHLRARRRVSRPSG